MYLKLSLVLVGLLTARILEGTNSSEFTLLSTTELLKKQMNLQQETNKHLISLHETLEKHCNHNEEQNQLNSSGQNELKKEIEKLNEDVRQNISQIQKQLAIEQILNNALTQKLYTEIRKIVNILKESEVNKKFRDEHFPKNCLEVMEKGNYISGTYFIQPSSDPFLVECDMETRGGGWTLIHNRFDGSKNFSLGWNEYKRGFGKISGEYWLGLDHIHQLTKNGSELLVKLVHKNRTEAYAYYRIFSIGNEKEEYNLKFLDGYEGNAGDSLKQHIGMNFTTKDHSVDFICHDKLDGGWWFFGSPVCIIMYSNLNGKYLFTKRNTGITWFTYSTDRSSLPAAKMMIRRRKT